MPLKVSQALRTPRRIKKEGGGKNWMSWLRAQGKLRIWRLSIMRTQTSARLWSAAQYARICLSR